MSDKTVAELTAFSVYLAGRREEVLRRWREAADRDPVQVTAGFLTRTQFNDHIPQLLDAFDRKLKAPPGGARAGAAEAATVVEDIKHGLQRWQQGYRLEELMHEWGHLHRCLFREIDEFGRAHPEVDRETLTAAERELIDLISHGINESAGQYARMQQAEAAGHAADLERALAKMTELERQRVALIHQTVHDLRSNVQSVGSAAEVLLEKNIAESARLEFARLVQQGIESVSVMLGELMALARLEAGLEKRELVPTNAAKLVVELCALAKPLAAERHLLLTTDGPASLNVETDPAKLRRLLQNLVLNALKYTEHGGVIVSWGEDGKRWWVIVKDTGPGLRAGPGSPIATNLNAATDSAREAEAQSGNAGGPSGVLPKPPGGSVPAVRRSQPGGEGIGLSIVKRLCELLEGSLELTSSAATGTSVRVLLPRSY